MCVCEWERADELVSELLRGCLLESAVRVLTYVCLWSCVADTWHSSTLSSRLSCTQWPFSFKTSWQCSTQQNSPITDFFLSIHSPLRTFLEQIQPPTTTSLCHLPTQTAAHTHTHTHIHTHTYAHYKTLSTPPSLLWTLYTEQHPYARIIIAYIHSSASHQRLETIHITNNKQISNHK